MGLTIVKTDARGAYRMVAQEDLYLNEDQTEIIVVKQGEEVPKEAAFVLAGRGGTIPVRYAEMLKTLDAPVEVKSEVKEVKVEPETKPSAEAKVKPQAAPSKSKPIEETPAQ
ncbi:MAG TPA: hypothetical protein VL866_24060 [Pyrinomonadaceae bacterium]|nr:hypothetical protein [Pyrinomonadaceae bacterium]